MKKIAFLFPGQGAQFVGMGKDFFDHFSEARLLFEEANDILERNLSKVVFEGPQELLTKTCECQSGLFVMSAAVLVTLKSQFPKLIPQIVAGLSLGEYTALFASHRLSFKDALKLVEQRGYAMSAACENQEGTMAAIFGLSGQQVEEMVQKLNLPNDLWAANFNAPTQTVISGTKMGVERGSEAAKQQGAKRVIPLQVHGAFHSGLMESAEKRLAPQIESISITSSDIGLVMNVPGDFVDQPSEISQNMIKQVTHPVRWEQSLKAMSDVDLFIEIGPGKTLNGLNKKNAVGVPTLSVGKLLDLDELAKHME